VAQIALVLGRRGGAFISCRRPALDPEAPMPQWGIAMVAAGDYRPDFSLNGLRRSTDRPPQRKTSGKVQAAYRAEADPGARWQRPKRRSSSAQHLKKHAIESCTSPAVAARRDPNLADRDAAYVAAWRAIIAAYPRSGGQELSALHLMGGFTTPAAAP